LNVEITDVNSCKKNLTAEVPAEQVEQALGRLAAEYARQAKIPGFRPGKVPLSIVKQRFGTDLRNDATHEIITNIWKQTVAERGIEAIAEPSVEKVESEPGSPLKFTLSYEIMPKLEVTEYKGIAVTIPAVNVRDEDVAEALETLRNRYAQFIPVESGGAQEGHLISMHLDGEIEGGGKPIHEEDSSLILGASQSRPEFSEHLKGIGIDEEREFDIQYGEDARPKRLAGKRVHYKAKIKDIKEKKLAELNDDFAKDLGTDNLEALRTRVRDDLTARTKQAAEDKGREAVLDQIVQRLTFDVPETLVHEELENNARRIAGNLARQGIDVSKVSLDWKKIFEEERPFADKAVRNRLVLDAISRQENFQVTDEEIEAEFQKMAEGTGKSAAVLRAQFEKDQRLQSFRQYLLQNKALDFIYRNATISEG
jgi:trigger factor